MQLGFVIDHTRCIGCHACTVACKAENDVPLGKFRTWVKYTEAGSFPDVRRSFAVLRCNQCTDAPCVEICPVRALDKRPDGIVDVDPAACIGCKACLQGCPYDALYINDASGTAQKCHFCAHRTEIGLAPACAVVCPTEAIVPGDFHDPASAVSRLRSAGGLAARKQEAGTGPNVWYREADPAGLDPLATDASGGYLWAERLPGLGLTLDAERFAATLAAAEERAAARTTYNVDHPAPWGGKVSAYLFTKSIAAGALLAAAALAWASPLSGATALGAVRALAWLALAFLLLTTALLVADLKRPARFVFILLRPNWRSWLARGAVVLTGFGALVGLLAIGVPAGGAALHVALAAAGILGVLTAAYTGWLFGQAKGRVLWMRRGLWLHLAVQAAVAGFAIVLLAQPWLALPAEGLRRVATFLLWALAVHAAFVLTEPFCAPRRREREYHLASRLVTHGPLALPHWALGVAAGIAAPAALLFAGPGAAWSIAAALALVGLYVEEDLLVRAGQALPIS